MKKKFGTLISIYFSETSQARTNALRARLAEIARGFGFVARRGETKGEGNLAGLLEAIDIGLVSVVGMLPDEQIPRAIARLDVIAAADPRDEWAKDIADALRDSQRRAAQAERREYDEIAAQQEGSADETE